MTIKIEFPFVSIMLALSFGVYGLIKIVHIDAINSIAIEYVLSLRQRIIYVIYLWQQHHMTFGFNMSSFGLSSQGQ